MLIAVTETHIREDTLLGEVEMEGFVLHHIRRANQVIKGGVGMYLRDDVAGEFGEVTGYSINNTEFMCIYSKKRNLVLCIIYRPGGLDGFSEALKEIENYIDSRAPPLPNVLMVGDFNSPI